MSWDRSVLGAALGGALGGAANGLLLYIDTPKHVIRDAEPGLVVVGLWHGLAIAMLVRLTLVATRRHSLLRPLAGYLAGVIGGTLGVLGVYCDLPNGTRIYVEALTSWQWGWLDWGFLFGGPIGAALGVAACLGPARSRLNLLARNVVVCELLCGLAACPFWCYVMERDKFCKDRLEYLSTALIHGATFGSMYALGVFLFSERKPPLPCDRVRLDESDGVDADHRRRPFRECKFRKC